MPTVNVGRDELFEKLEERFGSKPNQPSEEADEAMRELCFKFGIELDDVTSEKDMQLKETGAASEKASDEIIYKIDVPANRYDLLCVEGIAKALRVFLQKEVAPSYHLSGPAKEKLIIKSEVASIRPFAVAAVLRNMKFNERSYKSFIDLQEKLHMNICRRRTLVSIGTHDIDTIKGPFTYEARSPKDIKFAPLNRTQVMDGEELMNHLDNDAHLKKFLPIIRDSPVYPVIYDSQGIVLSLPPIINGDHSKITLNTKNVLIEVTATDLTKAGIVLNTIIAMFSEYCEDKFSVEPVEIVDASGKTSTSPDLSVRQMDVSVDYINAGIGIKLEPSKVAQVLTLMSLTSTLSGDQKTVTVSIPVTRTDILHPCDVMEDVAIAYGYDNIPVTIPGVHTEGKQQPLNMVSDMLRLEVALAGWTEVLTMALCSRDETSKMLNRPDSSNAITIANPTTSEFQVARTSLLVGVLKTVSHNRASSLPLKVFELSDVVLKTDTTDVGAHNKRNLCAIHCGHTSGFQIIQGLLDRVMQMLRIQWKGSNNNTVESYSLVPSEDPAFFPGLRADVLLNGSKIGVIGVVHPEVLANFHITFPCAAFEICIEPFV